MTTTSAPARASSSAQAPLRVRWRSRESHRKQWTQVAAPAAVWAAAVWAAAVWAAAVDKAAPSHDRFLCKGMLAVQACARTLYHGRHLLQAQFGPSGQTWGWPWRQSWTWSLLLLGIVVRGRWPLGQLLQLRYSTEWRVRTAVVLETAGMAACCERVTSTRALAAAGCAPRPAAARPITHHTRASCL